MTTVATHLVEALAAAGVERIYGVVGDSLNSMDAVHLQSGRSLTQVTLFDDIRGAYSFDLIGPNGGT